MGTIVGSWNQRPFAIGELDRVQERHPPVVLKEGIAALHVVVRWALRDEAVAIQRRGGSPAAGDLWRGLLWWEIAAWPDDGSVQLLHAQLARATYPGAYRRGPGG